MFKAVNKDAYILTKTYLDLWMSPPNVDATGRRSQATFQNKPACFIALVTEVSLTGGEITLSDYVF